MLKEIKTQNITNEEGFTLLEVLIAITILSMLMVSIYSIIDSSTTTKDKVLSEDREKMQFEMGITRLETDFEFIHSPLYFESTANDDTLYKKKSSSTSNANSTDNKNNSNDNFLDLEDETTNKIYEQNENFEGLSESNRPIPKLINDEKGSIIFMSSAGRRLLKNSKQSNLMWIRYSVINNSEPAIKEASFALTRTVIKEDLYKSQLDWDAAKEYVVLENLQSFEFNFWDPKKEKYVDSLRELTQDKQTPRLIKVKLTYLTKTKEVHDVIRTFRPIWPNFNTKKALEEKYKASSSDSGPTGGISGGSGNSTN